MTTAPVPISLLSASNSEDNAYRALRDLSEAAEQIRHVVLGGHMVNFHVAMHPNLGVPLRGTADADAGIVCEVGSAQDIHDILVARGYAQASGDRFRKGGQCIDVLVSELYGTHKSVTLGPLVSLPVEGLGVALRGASTSVSADVTLSKGEQFNLRTTIPDLPTALIIKAHAWRNRLAQKDADDIEHLLTICASEGVHASRINTSTAGKNATLTLKRLAASQHNRQVRALAQNFIAAK